MNKKALKWIFENTKFCFLPLGIITAVNVLFAGISLANAYITGLIVDCAVEKSVEGILFCGIILAGIIMCSFILRLIFRNLDEKFRVKTELELKKRFFEKILSRQYGKITFFHSSDLQNRMFGDVSVISTGIMSLVPSLADALVTAVGAFVMLAVIDVSFALFFLAAGVIVLSGTFIFKNKLKKLYKDVIVQETKCRSFVQEVFANLSVVKVFKSFGNVKNKNADTLNEYKNSRIRRTAFVILTTSAVAFVFEVSFAYTLLWGAFNICFGTVTYGTLAQALQLTGKIQGPAASFSLLASEFFRMIASVERLMEIEELESEQEFVLNEKEMDLIEFKNISFSYDEDLILEEADFKIEKNCFYAITGPSGIGKSTVLKLLSGILKPNDGRILVKSGENSVDVTNKCTGLFSYVPQGNLVFSGTVKENICFMANQIDEELFKFAIKVSMADEFINNLHDGADTYIGENGTGLSEGQIQRIAIARAVYAKSKIILLDEATSALDSETEKMVLSNLKELENVTVIFVSHKQKTVEICDKLLVLKDKKIYEEDSIN